MSRRTKNSIINTDPQTPLRRSARLLHLEENPPKPQAPTSTHKSKPKNTSSNALISSTKSNTLLKTQKKKPKLKSLKKLNESGTVTKTQKNSRMKPSKQLFRSSDRARKSSTLKIGVGGLQILRLSPIRSGSPINSMKYVTLSKTHEDSIMKASKKLFCSTDAKKKSSKLKSGVVALQSLRRSSRISNKRIAEEHVKKSGDSDSKSTSEDKFKKQSKCGLDKQKGIVGVDSCDKIVGKSEGRRTRKCVKGSKNESKVSVSLCEQIEEPSLSIVFGLKAGNAEGERKVMDVSKGSEEIKVKRKRKRGEDGKESSKIQGWTNEQEVALHRAYFAAKPTPNFWKRVSKLVPGKSAQECFDKVHSELITPPPVQPRSRVNKLTSSPVEQFSLSMNKLLKPINTKTKRPTSHKQKSHLAMKNVRHLLQKNYLLDQDHETDLFSILEPNINSSSQPPKKNGLPSPSTPDTSQEKHEFLQKCHDKSSGDKKSLSRFSGSSRTALVSPPVLKQVKNRALHERYIDQLHNRDAKRKAASAQAGRVVNEKETKKENNVQKTDVVRAAKNALVADARNAINQLQHLHAINNTSDFEDDIFDLEEEEEDEL